jgi:hypothetical protein
LLQVSPKHGMTAMKTWAIFPIFIIVSKSFSWSKRPPRGSEKVNAFFSDLGIGGGDQLRDPRLGSVAVSNLKFSLC